jgi:hypothetical protein
MTRSRNWNMRYPVLQRTLSLYAPQRPLERVAAIVRRNADDRFDTLAEIVGELGCPDIEIEHTRAPTHVVLRTTSALRELRIELQPSGGGEILSTAEFPIMTYLLERWQLDYRVWEELLPRDAKGSLPGRILTVRGYGRRGSLIARRAREIGLNVRIEESDPHRMLDALYDGFAPRGLADPIGGLVIDTLTDRDGPFALPAVVPSGLADETSALATVALTALSTCGEEMAAHEGRRRVIEMCDRSLAGIIIQYRGCLRCDV